LELDAGPVDLAGATAEEGATGGVEGEKITGESGDMDEAGEKKVGQFDKHTEVGYFSDHGGEGLGWIGASLHFEVFEEF